MHAGARRAQFVASSTRARRAHFVDVRAGVTNIADSRLRKLRDHAIFKQPAPNKYRPRVAASVDRRVEAFKFSLCFSPIAVAIENTLVIIADRLIICLYVSIAQFAVLCANISKLQIRDINLFDHKKAHIDKDKSWVIAAFFLPRRVARSFKIDVYAPSRLIALTMGRQICDATLDVAENPGV